MKLTKILLEYPGAFTPRPKEEWDKNQEEIKKRKEEEDKKRDPNYIIEQYIENGSVGGLEINGDYHDVEMLTSLPDNFTVRGDFVLSGCWHLAGLPKNLTVEGSFYMFDCWIKYLPDDLKVQFNIICYRCPLVDLPDNFTVEYQLELLHTKVSEIPYNLTIGTNLIIDHTPLIENYTAQEIKKMIEDRGGTVGEIWF